VLKREIGSYTLQFIIPKISEDGAVSFAVMKYTKTERNGRNFTNIRLPAETGKPGETVPETFQRGLLEEVAGNKDTFRARMIGFCHAQLTDDEDWPQKLHAKIAVIVSFQRGDFRDYKKDDEDDADESHGPIVFMEANQLIRDGMGGCRLLQSHEISICAYIANLAMKDSRVAGRYHTLLEKKSAKIRQLTEEEDAKVRRLLT
jgi:hypothetical protein